MKKVIVTTSWDDGHQLDLRLAQLLQDAGLKGTFYISPGNRELPERDRLNSQQVSDLSSAFEIGAHTLTHPRLPKVSLVDARREIAGSKVALEEIKEESDSGKLVFKAAAEPLRRRWPWLVAAAVAFVVLAGGLMEYVVVNRLKASNSARKR